MAASIRDIKARVVATKKTAQITKAMNMVSASKLKGAQKATESFRPYMQRVEEIISSVTPKPLTASKFFLMPSTRRRAFSICNE